MIENMEVSEMARMGGKARWKGTTKEERSEAGRKAIAARWAKAKATKKAAKKAK